MSRGKNICLFTGIILLFMIFVCPASSTVGLDSQNPLKNETYEKNSVSNTSETELIEMETALGFHFLTSMLKMLDLNLNLINETLNAHIEEYPFLNSSIEGTNTSIKTVDSIISVLQTDPENLSDIETKLIALNETMAQLNTSIEYSDNMVKAANSTMGEDNVTTPLIGDMFKDVQKMVSLLDQL
jgi:hypothetical protein